MSATLCFALSTTTFTGPRTSLTNKCRRSPQRRLSTRRVRATATEAEAERPQNAELTEEARPQKAELAEEAFEQEVPGKIVLDEIELAKQKNALDMYAKELRQKRLTEEREAARLFGWVPYAETLNGRLAMFFILTGLLTEYWTGYTIPEQVELMLRTLGVI